MSAIVDIRNVGAVCRLCLSMDEPKSSVFADQTSTVSLATKIQACLSIEILASDRVSTMICSRCLKRVNKWHTYKEYCLRSQQKLQQCLGDQTENLGSIKVEPMDYYEPTSPFETVPLSSEDDSEGAAEVSNQPLAPTLSSVIGDNPETNVITTIKREPLDADNPVTVENESLRSPELLLNPMAVVAQKGDRLMEADSTQKVKKAGVLRGTKKKIRRGPHTHYRGKGKRFKQKCGYCQINLHSKTSYAKHMERFHSGKVYTRKAYKRKESSAVQPSTEEHETIDDNENNDDTAEEMIEDVEDELISLEKDAPLTPVQQNIISQLKTFSCYSCKQCFNDRRSTLNHIRQHMPDLRPYTCIACLTEFADRSIYKLHCGASFQCAMKIALVVPVHGTEKYFTCNMCLRSLTDRKELLIHLSKHSDKQYEQLMAKPYRSPPKLKPISPVSTKIVDSVSDVKRTKIIGNDKKRRLDGPFNEGDPAYNHHCAHCDMIYRHRPNMLKHVTVCEKLAPEERITYKCAECGRTYLAFNKFYNHTTQEHRRKYIVCYHCNTRYKESKDFLMHYREHFVGAENCQNADLSATNDKVERWREINENDKIDDVASATTSTNKSARKKKLLCGLCPKSYFPTNVHLTEHRRIFHPKLEIFSCSLCSCSFGKASILEAHMADHEIGILPPFPKDSNTTIPPILEDQRETATNNAELNNTRFSIKSDPGTSNTECHTCGKVFANYPNLRRHIRTVHDAIGRFSCFTCAKTFVREEQWREHVDNEHKNQETTSNCPQCPEKFTTQQFLDEHRRDIHGLHGEDYMACYICGKSFANEISLKIHRGHHFRVNSRLSIGNLKDNVRDDDTIVEPVIEMLETPTPRIETIEDNDTKTGIRLITKSQRARKSFPNSPPNRQYLALKGNPLQCQVCDDSFKDVADLRKHLWDVHCARNKPEKPFTTEKLQCELCTNILPDEDSLASHMKWHASNPILGNREKREPLVDSAASLECDLCGKFYGSINSLRKHKKRHKATEIELEIGNNKITASNTFKCYICRKTFAGKSNLIKHKLIAHPTVSRGNASGPSNVAPTKRNASQNDNRSSNEIKPIRPRLDFDTLVNQVTFTSSANDDTSQTVECNLCKKVVAHARALTRHRRNVHKIFISENGKRNDINPYSTDETQVACPICKKLFRNITNMRQHYAKVHTGVCPAPYRCSIDGCKLIFNTLLDKQNHEKSHANVMYTCALCPRHMLSPTAMADHMLTAHKTNFQTGNRKIALCKKTDLNSYVVKGANGRQCPMCKIIYPNNKALKIHYLKVHENAT